MAGWRIDVEATLRAMGVTPEQIEQARKTQAHVATTSAEIARRYGDRAAEKRALGSLQEAVERSFALGGRAFRDMLALERARPGHGKVVEGQLVGPRRAIEGPPQRLAISDKPATTSNPAAPTISDNTSQGGSLGI